ncbi:VOC family protein [Streptomyces griseoviridis]|uniref:Glyoxalase n=2 Tax=Streptomyces TaxID=1883 RepID=A0A3S9ZP18_STRGD|nr:MULTISPECIES: VOC family protein [Streptomyces]AZS89514.1 VOC family protein [Streptomyces griseoviridis]MDH6699205.1 putative enzyme related to lactoylglutathione lyase [Streptomyces sp. MAA16]MDT0473750.1 VOC family protein [Streptomyces sp. DSM 41014]QCN83647.1 glyoxalase [Streptomyces griseoviridis]
MTVRIEGPDFVALQVRDVEAAAAFCEHHLGLRRAPASPPGAVVFDTKPIPMAVRQPLPGTDLDAGRPGLGVALWFATSDAHALHDRLTTSGVEILTPVTDSPFGPMFSFTGPEGYVLTAHGA